MLIAVTGATGNIGEAFLTALDGDVAVDKIRVLCRSEVKARALIKKYKNLAEKFEIVIGELTDGTACVKLVSGCDMVINLAGVIPPEADADPRAAVKANETGVKTLVDATELCEKKPIFIHASSVAVYGNRSGKTAYGKVGDPLLSGPYELYGATKIRGERIVLRSKLEKKTVLRLAPVLHGRLLSDNLKSGLMFKTCFTAPLEWVTAKDCGALLLGLVKKADSLHDGFWNKIYNVGGGAASREYGYNTYDTGFKLIGGGIKDFFKPCYNAIRNFHGMWFSDSDELEKAIPFRTQTAAEFWEEMKTSHKTYALGKALPKAAISYFVIRRLLKSPEAPAYWAAHCDIARLTAYFGSESKYAELQNATWNDIELPTAVPDYAPLSYREKSDIFGFDIEKPDAWLKADDLKAYAEAHGGKLLTPEKFDGMYAPLEWENSDGEKFEDNAYTVVRGGHWQNPLYGGNVWDFDRLCKKDKVFAHFWYESHEKDEDRVYSLDANNTAIIQKI